MQLEIQGQPRQERRRQVSGKQLTLVVLVLFMVAVSLSGCCGFPCGSISWPFRSERTRMLRGSGNLETREMDLSGFTRLDVSHAFRVYLTQSDTFRVIITADDNVWDSLEVSMWRDTLKLGFEPGAFTVQDVTHEAEISMPTLKAVELSGASRLSGDIESGDLAVDVSGASQLTLDGSGGDLTLDASGASKVDLSQFVVGDANVDASGASQVTVNVEGRLDADASGASRVYYRGNPTLGRIDTSGASRVERD
jgi:hypothetical protein